MNGPTPIRLGIVGLGNWGTKLARTLKGIAGAELAACFARTPERRDMFAAEHGCRAATSLDDLLGAALDGVLVATPHTTHVELVEAIAGSGINVMVEKPLALTVADAKRCVRAADKAGVLLQVAHYRRRVAATRAIRRLIDEGSLGALHLVEGHFSRRWRPDTIRPWRDDPAEAPAGGMTALGVHMADNLLYFAGPAVRVSCFSTRIGAITALDDMTGALIEFASGAVGTLTTSLRIPKIVTCAAHGSEMVAWSEADGSRFFTLKGDGEERVEHEVEPKDAVAENLAHFVDCVRSGSQPETGGPEGLAVVAILEAMTTSAANNGAVVELASPS